MCGLIMSGCKKKIVIENTKYFRYSYSVGVYVNGNSSFEIEKLDDKYMAYYKPVGMSEEKRMEKEVTTDYVLGLEKILNDHTIYKWNGFNKADKYVLDGNDFHLTYKKDDDITITASGYMKYPDGYRGFESDIGNYFEELFKEELEKQKTTNE